MRFSIIRQFMLALVAVFSFTAVNATSVLQMNLNTMAQGADKVFSGVVIDIQQRYIQAGGGQIPTLDYKLLLSEDIKGNLANAEQAKEDGKVVTVSMLGTLDRTGTLKTRQTLPSFPVLELGTEYLLMMSPNSSIGLASPIGLAQGCFKVITNEKTGDKQVLNQANNIGLFKGMSVQNIMPAEGPVSLDQVRQMINQSITQ